MARMDKDVSKKEYVKRDKHSSTTEKDNFVTNKQNTNGNVVNKQKHMSAETDMGDQNTTTDRLLPEDDPEKTSHHSDSVIKTDLLHRMQTWDCEKGKNTSSKQSSWRHFRRKENIVCLTGCITLCIGIILITASFFIINKSCPQTQGVTNLANETSSTTSPIPIVDSHTTSGHENGHVTGTYVSVPHFNDRNSSHETQSVNLAEGKPCTQSTTFEGGGTLYYAGLAVDGRLGHSFSQGMCSQTEWEEKPYWIADLGDLDLVKRVTIIIPDDCCAGEMYNFEIRIGQHRELSLNSLCRAHTGPTRPTTVRMECERQLYGRYVSVQILGDETRPSNRLTLCEIMVYRN